MILEQKMGLHIRSLSGIPDVTRGYYIYLLDYGWHEPLGQALYDNFQKMAEIASDNNAVVIRSAGNSVHFCSEVFSWHNINGQNADDVLPAIMITSRHPRDFKESYSESDNRQADKRDYKIVVFPLRKYCKTTTDVVKYVDKIFKDIVEKNDLSDFKVVREIKKGMSSALVDGILLEPNIAGVGYNFRPLLDYLSGK